MRTIIQVKLGDLTGPDGNAFVILGKVKNALERSGRHDLVDEYLKEATGGDYEHLLKVTSEYVEVV